MRVPRLLRLLIYAPATGSHAECQRLATLCDSHRKSRLSTGWSSQAAPESGTTNVSKASSRTCRRGLGHCVSKRRDAGVCGALRQLSSETADTLVVSLAGEGRKSCFKRYSMRIGRALVPGGRDGRGMLTEASLDILSFSCVAQRRETQ